MKSTSSLYSWLLATLAPCVAFAGSKKDLSKNTLSDSEIISKAKTSYYAGAKLRHQTISSSKGQKAELIFTPSWKGAVVCEIGANTVITMPVTSNLAKVFRNTDYELIASFG